MTKVTKGANRRATINDVARAAQVSRQTVSNVVNRPDRVAPDTRARVEAEIERLAYRPSSAAKSLREQRAGAVGLELNTLGHGRRGDIIYPFTVELSIGARGHDCHIVTFGSDSDRPSITGYEAMVRARLVDAFVLADTHHDDPRPAWLDKAGIPYATFGRVWDAPDFTGWADVDGAAGTSAAVDHLVAEGYSRVGFLGWPEGSATGDDRRRGWREACERHGIYRESLQASTIQELHPAEEAAAPLIEAVGTGGAIVCVSDVIALAVQQVLLQSGRRPGIDLGITGFDGSPLAEMNDISSVEQPLDQIADELLSQISDRLAGQPLPEQGTLLTPTFVPRASSRRGVEHA